MEQLSGVYVWGGGGGPGKVSRMADGTQEASAPDLWSSGKEPTRLYDFNVWTERKRLEKLRYMHHNPVKRGLVLEPDQWAWSSFRWYSRGEMGAVRLNDASVLKMRIRRPAA
jgi:hypothetical protein